jgi:DNA-binding MarR family transcriptional regulator
MSEKIQIEKALCFNLYSASRLMTQVYRPYLQKFDLTYPQFLVMTVLWSKDKYRVKELGSRLYLDSGTLTPLLKRLEKMNLVTRDRSTSDEREVFVNLTRKGKSLEKKCRDIPFEMFCKLNVSEKRFHDILSGVTEILRNLKENLN